MVVVHKVNGVSSRRVPTTAAVAGCHVGVKHQGQYGVVDFVGCCRLRTLGKLSWPACFAGHQDTS